MQENVPWHGMTGLHNSKEICSVKYSGSQHMSCMAGRENAWMLGWRGCPGAPDGVKGGRGEGGKGGTEEGHDQLAIQHMNEAPKGQAGKIIISSALQMHQLKHL